LGAFGSMYINKYQLTPMDPLDDATRPLDYRAVHGAERRAWSTIDDRRRLL